MTKRFVRWCKIAGSAKKKMGGLSSGHPSLFSRGCAVEEQPLEGFRLLGRTVSGIAIYHESSTENYLSDSLTKMPDGLFYLAVGSPARNRLSRSTSCSAG